MSRKLRAHLEKITPLSDDEFEYVRSHFTTREIKKCQFLVQEGNYVFKKPRKSDRLGMKYTSIKGSWPCLLIAGQDIDGKIAE